MRLLRGLRIVRRYQTYMSISYGAITLSKCFIQLVFIAHWEACLWGLQTTFFASPLNTWLGANAFCVEIDDAEHRHIDCAMIDEIIDGQRYTGEVCCEDGWSIYLASIYWAVATITSIGYGDISATNKSERLTGTLLMLSSALVWGQVLAAFCGVLSTMNPDRTAYYNTIDDLNRFMAKAKIPKHTWYAAF